MRGVCTCACFSHFHQCIMGLSEAARGAHSQGRVRVEVGRGDLKHLKDLLSAGRRQLLFDLTAGTRASGVVLSQECACNCVYLCVCDACAMCCILFCSVTEPSMHTAGQTRHTTQWNVHLHAKVITDKNMDRLASIDLDARSINTCPSMSRYTLHLFGSRQACSALVLLACSWE